MDQLLELWRMFWRRFWIIALISLLGLPIVALYAYLKPATYLAEAKILVESQQIPDDLARSTVTAGAGERLQLIQQRLMARNNLQNLIQQLGLFANRSDLTLTEKIALVRLATNIQPITLTGQRSRRGDVLLSAFIIKVILENPGKAAELANEFVTIVLDQNLRARSQRARETTSFFTQEQERLNSEIIALEQEITLFKETNKDALPESLGFRQSELSRLADGELEIDQRRLELEEERRSALAEIDALAITGTPVSQQSLEEREIRALERVLLQKQAVLADSHPEIRTLRNRIRALTQALPETRVEDSGSSDTISREEAAFKRKLELLETQMALLQDQKLALQAKRTELTETLQRTPGVEIQLNALNRRLKEKQEMHSVITRKRTEAETGERMEINQQAERFEVIENAIVPNTPIAPDRKKLVMMGSIGVIGLALALAFLIEKARPRVRSAGQMERQLGLKAVVALPYVRTRREAFRRWTAIASMATVVIIAIPAGLYAIDQHYLPLQLLLERAGDKIGIDEIMRRIDQRF